MPFKPADAAKHKKGLSKSDSQKWAAIANNVLKDCQDENGDDCEGKAIRVANSKTKALEDVMIDEAQEEKGMRHFHGYDGEVVEAMPWDAYSATSFADLDRAMESQDQAEHVKMLTEHFKRMTENIMRDSDIDDKGAAIQTLTDEFLARVKTSAAEESDDKEAPAPVEVSPDPVTYTAGDKTTQHFVTKTINFLRSLVKGKDDEGESDLFVWKEGDIYRWLARYSNSFRDNDLPAEIISSKSHQRFVELVEKGVEPLPELWLWHVPEWKVGEADWVAYDEVKEGIGFALAGGHFHPETYWVAESLEKSGAAVGTSHGMPRKLLKRDETDETIITEHVTREISILPDYARANSLADFHVLEMKENEMAIPTHKREAIIKQWKIDPEKLDALEQLNARDSQKALAEEIEFKEASMDEQKQPEAGGVAATQEPPQTPASTDPPASPSADQPQADVELSLPKEQVLALAALVKEAVEQVMAPVVARLDTLEKAKSEADEAAEKNVNVPADEMIPAASVRELIATSIIGKEGARVDGRESLAKSKPKTDKDPADGITGVGFIDSILAEHTHGQAAQN